MNSISTNPGYSHPDQPVRHSYPLATKSEGFSTALRIALQTMPYILLRLGVLVGFTLAALIWLALCGGIASLFSGKDGSSGGAILFLIGVGAPAGLFFWFRNYVLYLLKAGHVAILTRLIVDGSLPPGVNQIEYGKEIVKAKFAQTNLLFVLDSIITGVVNAFNRTLDWLAGLLPIPGLDSAMQVVNKIVHNATTYIDETIFSYNLARNDENVWRSAADGLVYYGMNVKAVLKTAVWSLVFEYAFTFAAFIVCLLPMALVAKVLPDAVAGFAWIFAVVLAFNIRAAVVHPIMLTMVALTFHVHAHGQAIDPQIAAVLEGASDKFRELLERARSWVQDRGKGAAAEQIAAV